MKAKVLLDLFTPKEHLLFEKTVIRLHKRKRLKKLYQVLKKELPPSKEVLYKKVFEVPYEDKKDALLRNELRLLSNAVELFLVQQRELAQINLQQYATKLSLLHIYAERQQWDYFEQLWQRLYKTAVQEQDYQQQIELVQLWLKEKLLIGENSEALFQEIKTQLNITQTAIWGLFSGRILPFTSQAGICRAQFIRPQSALQRHLARLSCSQPDAVAQSYQALTFCACGHTVTCFMVVIKSNSWNKRWTPNLICSSMPLIMIYTTIRFL